MRVLTRGDLDGLTSAVFISLVEKVTEVKFAHPKDVQDGRVPCDAEDVVVNLPYVPGCGLWFDHHVSEKGKLDAAKLTKLDVTNPKGWILLGYTIDPRTGLGPEFQKYFRWLVEYVKEVPLAKILKHPEVKKRADRVIKEQAAYKKLLKTVSKADGSVIVTDLREVKAEVVGNRFLVYTMYPKCNVEVRIFRGKGGETVNCAIGHSIFNRTCKVSAGDLCASYGGGGHFGAGTCQLPLATAAAQIQEIIAKLKQK